MQADWSVELAADDAALELPWAAEDGSSHFYDLKRQPDLLLYIREAAQNRELAEFLVSVNSERSPLLSAKCDTWLTDQLDEEERIYCGDGDGWKFASYVDLVFAESDAQQSLEQHERLARSLAVLLGKAPEVSAAAEFIIRRCYYHRGDDSPVGYCLTAYLHGYGSSQDEARQRWAVAIKLVQHALVQVSAESRAH